MIGILKKWASQFLYTTGPKVGKVTKSKPVSLVAQGIQPGTGNKITAEEMNYLLNALLQDRKDSIIPKFTDFTETSIRSDTYDSYLSGLGRHPVTGRYYLVVRDPGVNSRLAEITFDGGITAPNTVATIASLTFGDDVKTDAGTFVTSDDVDGNGPGLYVAAGLASDFRIFHSNDGGVPGNWAAVTNDFTPPTGVDTIISMSYDDVANAVVGCGMNDTQAPLFFRILDGASPSLTLPSTVPTFTVAAFTEPYMLASGSGTTIALYTATGATAYACFKSTDGGDVWTAATAPAAPTAGEMLGLYYDEDFLGEGPHFIAITQDGTDLLIYTSDDDATTWDLQFSDTVVSYNHTLGGSYLMGAFFVSTGSVNTNEIRVLDLTSGKTHTFFHGFFVDDRLASDGTRLMLSNFTGTSGQEVLVSKMIRSGKATDNTDMDD